MKTTVFFGLLIIGYSMNAQDPYLNLVTEEIPIEEPSYSIIESELGGAPSTWRVSVNIPENYELQMIIGDIYTPLSLNSTTQFYQHSAGGPTTLQINPSLYASNPELIYDSWFTIGYDDFMGNLAIIVPDESVFDDWEAGNDILFNDLVGASLFVPTLGFYPQNYPDENGNVLVLQVTSDGIVNGCFNFQLRRLNPDGTIYDPPGEETSEVVLFSDYCFTLGVDPNGCLTDFNSSGNVASDDLLILLPAMGCTIDCDIDPSGDGLTSTDDLLILLAEFGSSRD